MCLYLLTDSTFPSLLWNIPRERGFSVFVLFQNSFQSRGGHFKVDQKHSGFWAALHVAVHGTAVCVKRSTRNRVRSSINAGLAVLSALQAG
jgi:hypothetical protein